MLLAEELALLAIDPDTGRHKLGTGDALNACLGGAVARRGGDRRRRRRSGAGR